MPSFNVMNALKRIEEADVTDRVFNLERCSAYTIMGSTSIILIVRLILIWKPILISGSMPVHRIGVF
jgi:hypothetical protein